MHHQRHAPLDEHLVRREQRGVVDPEAAVHRVQLQSRRAEVELATQLLVDREVQVRVDVGHRPEPPRVLLHDRQQVLETLVAGGLRAVLAQQQRHVHTLGGEQLVERHGVGAAVGVPDAFHQPLGAEVASPLQPRRREAGQQRHVYVRVDEQVTVQHSMALVPRMAGHEWRVDADVARQT